ncbi:hypothetical protein [uncultured Winogradskyella sp.]|uniref:hypothetical protein n=1 Tax=uncultured Winogradskyella sp. TaxID=395353 RepID=UPI0026230BBB|nr:hypothetical protein [uncultured Winogradskyella sp.]
MIQTITHIIANWQIVVSDRGNLNKNNPNKIDYNSLSRICHFNGCRNPINIRRTSGLCDEHQTHQHDLLLSLKDNEGINVGVPAHQDIIDCLIEWAKSRNYNLSAFFEKISFSILGNVPDVTSLAGEITYDNIETPNFDEIFNNCISVAEEFFPSRNNSSYQPLSTRTGDIPIIVLAHIFIGLIVCEEANRGDRWHCRIIRKDETKTSQLGGAMPIAYYAAKSFNWGIEMGKSARFLTR